MILNVNIESISKESSDDGSELVDEQGAEVVQFKNTHTESKQKLSVRRI